MNEDGKQFEQYKVYEPEAPVPGSENTKPEDQKTQSAVVVDNSVKPDGEPEKLEEKVQVEPAENLIEPSKPGGDTLEITDDVTYKMHLKDGTTVEISGDELTGGMVLKQRYDEWHRTEKQPLEEKAARLDAVNEAYSDKPSEFLVNHLKMSIDAGTVDPARFLHQVYQMARQAGLDNVNLVDLDTGEEFVPQVPRAESNRSDPALQRQLQDAQTRMFQAEMKADRVEAFNMPEFKQHGIQVTDVIRARADQIYTLYRSNPNYSPDPRAGNQYSLALITAWNEAIGLGKVKNPALEKPTQPSLVKQQSSPKRAGPTTPLENADPLDQAFKKYKVY